MEQIGNVGTDTNGCMLLRPTQPRPARDTTHTRTLWLQVDVHDLQSLQVSGLVEADVAVAGALRVVALALGRRDHVAGHSGLCSGGVRSLRLFEAKVRAGEEALHVLLAATQQQRHLAAVTTCAHQLGAAAAALAVAAAASPLHADVGDVVAALLSAQQQLAVQLVLAEAVLALLAAACGDNAHEELRGHFVA